MDAQLHFATPARDLRQALVALNAERALAGLTGLSANAAYMDDLDADLREMRRAYVVAAVSEIASLRAELSAPLAG
jgi:hypothetical protein